MTVFVTSASGGIRKAVLCPECQTAAKVYMNTRGGLRCACGASFILSRSTKYRRVEEMSADEIIWAIRRLDEFRAAAESIGHRGDES